MTRNLSLEPPLTATHSCDYDIVPDTVPSEFIVGICNHRDAGSYELGMTAQIFHERPVRAGVTQLHSMKIEMPLYFIALKKIFKLFLFTVL